MKQITMIGAAVGLMLGVPVAAQTVQVPCAEFVQITGRKMACDKVPMLKMSQEKYEQEKAAYEARLSGEADVPPWKRQAKAGDKKESDVKVHDGCDMPPWKRREGLKCD